MKRPTRRIIDEIYHECGGYPDDLLDILSILTGAPMGRPTLPTNLQRRPVPISLSADEKAEIDELARLLKTSRSEAVRSAVRALLATARPCS